MKLSGEAEALFTVLRQSAKPEPVNAIKKLIEDAPDRELCRINALAFAAEHELDEEDVIAAFLHGARRGIFDVSWNILCPGCGGVLDSGTTLKTVNQAEYRCALCAVGYEPTLDEIVEVTFTISPRVRKIAAHDPETLPWIEYYKQVYWSSGFDLPDDETLAKLIKEVTLDTIELPAGEKVVLSLQLPEAFVIVFDPVVHMSQFIEVTGEPTRKPQSLAFVMTKDHAPTGTIQMRPGPLRISLENRSNVRTLPGIWVAGNKLHDLLASRRPFLTAKRLLTNQTFRDIYRTDTLDLDQRLKITSLTFLFTDLKGSTELYERVGDLVAYDLVRAHFQVLNEIVAAERGAVVKTIGDAVMATFPTPDRAMAAALKMRGAVKDLKGDLLLKIGIHEGPCLAVSLNDRQDYFGRTVNIAARVQGLATSRSIFATRRVVTDSKASKLLQSNGIAATPEKRSLRGIANQFEIFEIP
ncbi:MAG: adenylate/guanylate cyclase domain-containing protein [Verrucomicrobia bacterium]|nr:MAG: adenylate/guanylate cyclase domain-containing protein [Verrucomicrobiota bacterium]